MSNYNRFSVSSDFMAELVRIGRSTNTNVNPDLWVIANDAVKLESSIGLYNLNKEVEYNSNVLKKFLGK